MKLIRTLDFVELHEFLPAPLLRAAVADTATDCKCCVAKDKEKRSPKTVADIYTWLLCFHRFTAAASSIHPGKVGQFLAYANTVLQAYIQFEGDGWRAYDRAFRLKVAGRPLVDWATLDLPLYARIFTAQVRRGNSCRDCGGLDHPTTACPWGVDVHLPVPPGTSTPPMGAPYTGTSPLLRPRPPTSPDDLLLLELRGMPFPGHMQLSACLQPLLQHGPPGHGMPHQTTPACPVD